MAMLGWCSTGHHAGMKLKYGRNCPGKMKKVNKDEYSICDCKCHGKGKVKK